jgi:hypothetical protein
MSPARKRWPLIVIGAAAGASTWSGWVGLGSLTGFGVVKPFPGIADNVALNTAITLPIGVEAYAIYALYVATSSERLTDRARGFAWASSGAALALGMFGQAAYHLMAAGGIASAPPWVVVAVSCLPVLVLGAASLLWHLAGEGATDTAQAETTTDGTAELQAALDEAVERLRQAEDETHRAVDAAVAAVLAEQEALRAKAVADAIAALKGRQSPPPPVTVPDTELDRIIRAALADSPDAGYTTVTTAIKDAGWSVGNTGRVKDAIRAAKNPTLRVVAGGQ